MPKKILITGFEPFLNQSINPSQILASALAKDFYPQADFLILPVSYENSFAKLAEHLKNNHYDILLMLGQASGRKALCLERVALNWSETTTADADGVQLAPGPLLDQAPSSYIVNFFPKEWAALLQDYGPTEISFSAGTYVCNALYFQVLHDFSCRDCSKNKTKILFVHLPLFPEQTLHQDSVAQNIQHKVLTQLLELLTA